MQSRYSKKVAFKPTIVFGTDDNNDDDELGSASRPSVPTSTSTSTSATTPVSGPAETASSTTSSAPTTAPIRKGFKSELREVQKDEDKAREFMAKNAPPYAPQLSTREMQMLAKFISKKEEKLRVLFESPMYLFVLQVAGLSNRTVEDLLKFRSSDRYFPFKGLQIPSFDYMNDLTENRKPVNNAFVRALAERKFQQVKMMFEQQAKRTYALRDVKFDTSAVTGFAAYMGFSTLQPNALVFVKDRFPEVDSSKLEGYDKVAIENLINYYRVNLQVLKLLTWEKPEEEIPLDDMDVNVLRKKAEEFMVDPEVSMSASNIAGDERSILIERIKGRENEIFEFGSLQEVLFVVQKAIGARGSDQRVVDPPLFSIAKDIEHLFPSIGNKNVPDSFLFVYKKHAQPSTRFQLADQAVNDLLSSQAKLSHSTSRERMYSALQWIAQPENIGYADMSESLVAALTMAVALLNKRVASMSNLASYQQVLASDNKTFVTMFAELVAKLILESEIIAPTRMHFDKSEDRMVSRLNRILFAFRKFRITVRGDSVRVTEAGRSCSVNQQDSAYYAYR